MIEFDGNTGYFIPGRHKYQLSRYELSDITENSFSFVVKVKINWDLLNPFDKTKEAGIICKNGQHIGISAFKYTDYKNFIKGAFWTKDDNGNEFYNDIVFEIDDAFKNKILNLAFTYDSIEKKIRLYFFDEHKEIKFDKNLLDYSNSLLWIGCQNAFDSCDENHRGYFFGEIHKVYIYGKNLTKNDITQIFSLENEYALSARLNPICGFDFNKKTPYKIFDITNNGNNLIKFDKNWHGIH